MTYSPINPHRYSQTLDSVKEARIMATLLELYRNEILPEALDFITSDHVSQK